MSDENTAYYIASGRSLENVLAWNERECKAVAARTAFLDSLGTRRFFGSDEEMTGLHFDDPAKVPPGWRKKANAAYFVPDRKTPEGRVAAKAMKTLVLSRNFGVPPYFHGMTLSRPGVEQVGDKWVISHHPNAKPPDDAIPLKRSEFWRMKEETKAGEAVPA